MEYEGERAIAEVEMEDAKSKAMNEAEQQTFKVDPIWLQPAETTELRGVGIDQAQGFWINGGKQGGPKDEPMAASTFDHDLPNLVKNGPKELPEVPNTPAGRLTAADTDRLMKARSDPTDEDLANLLNCTVLDMYKRIAGGLYSKENLINVYKSGLRSA